MRSCVYASLSLSVSVCLDSIGHACVNIFDEERERNGESEWARKKERPHLLELCFFVKT